MCCRHDAASSAFAFRDRASWRAYCPTGVRNVNSPDHACCHPGERGATYKVEQLVAGLDLGAQGVRRQLVLFTQPHRTAGNAAVGVFDADAIQLVQRTQVPHHKVLEIRGGRHRVAMQTEGAQMLQGLQEQHVVGARDLVSCQLEHPQGSKRANGRRDSADLIAVQVEQL